MKTKHSKLFKRVQMLNIIDASPGLRLIEAHARDSGISFPLRCWVPHSKTLATTTRPVTSEYQVRVVCDMKAKIKLRFYFSKINGCEVEVSETDIETCRIKRVLSYLDALGAHSPKEVI